MAARPDGNSSYYLEKSQAPDDVESISVKAAGSSSAGMYALIIAGVICLIVGALYLSQITAGVGAIAAACFFAICARIAQAGRQ